MSSLFKQLRKIWFRFILMQPAVITSTTCLRWSAAGGVVRSKPAHFLVLHIFLLCHPFIQGGRFSTYCFPFLFVQITRVIFCVFLETDFVIYKRKMSLLFQGTCVYSKLTGVINPASLHLIYYPLTCWGELDNELMNT